MTTKRKLIIPTPADLDHFGGGGQKRKEWYTWEARTPHPVSDPPECGPMERTYFYDGFAIRTFFKRDAGGTITQIWGDKSIDQYVCTVLERHPNGRVASLETKSWIMMFDEEGAYIGAGNKLAIQKVRIEDAAAQGEQGSDQQDQGTGGASKPQKGPPKGSTPTRSP